MKYSQRILNERGEPATSLFSGEINLDAEGRFRIDDLIPGVIQIEAFRRFFDVDLLKTTDDDQPLGSDGTCWIVSRTAPFTSGKETRYGRPGRSANS
ncbi:MAG: hypothetical protein ACKV2Q_11385 [Planctomycetaceae bacterium]